jgi:hypothetical protein
VEQGKITASASTRSDGASTVILQTVLPNKKAMKNTFFIGLILQPSV